TLKVGANQHGKEGARIQAPSQKQAAAMLNVSRDSVQKGRMVIERGTGGLQHAVDAGRVSVSAAAALALADKDSQVRVLALADDEIIDEAAHIKRSRQVAKRAPRRSESRADLLAGLKVTVPAVAKKTSTRSLKARCKRSITSTELSPISC